MPWPWYDKALGFFVFFGMTYLLSMVHIAPAVVVSGLA